MTAEIRFTITDKLDKILLNIAEKYGVDKSDYVRSLILNDLRAKEYESLNNSQNSNKSKKEEKKNGKK